jgi:alcohol dehydrogenase class IV
VHPVADDFTWIDGERLIRYGAGVLDEVPEVLGSRGFERYALLTTPRTLGMSDRAAALRDGAAAVLDVPSGRVDEAAAALRDEVQGRPLVALGGGRVIDTAKAIAGADGLPCAAIPTTLSGAPMTRFHRKPAGAGDAQLVRPSLVIAEPGLMASQPPQDRAASAMNALAHAAEALYGPLANPVAEMAGLRAAELLSGGLQAHTEQEAQPRLALGALLAGYAVGSAGFALHHVVGQSFVRVTGASHAHAYAVLLPSTLAAMTERAPDALGKLAVALGHPEPDPAAAATLVAKLAAAAGPSRLSELGVDRHKLPEAARAAAARPDLPLSTPDPPDEAELLALLEGAY